MKRNRLQTSELVALADWLRESEGKLKDSQPTYAEAARIAGDVLERRVSASQVKRIAEELGIAWEPRKAARITNGSMRKIIELLVESHVDLLEKLEQPVDQQLKDLAS